MSGRIRGFALALLCGSGLIGCAMLPPYDQPFVEVRTPHFEILSAFGEADSRALARTLELFHAGMDRALGIESAADTRAPLRVLAFDDRSPGRPFGIRGESAYSVPSVDRPTIVLRTSPGWREVTSVELRHQIAHRRLRDATPHRYPLWLEEGLAQLAGSIDVRGERVLIGQPIGDHATRIRDWRRGSLERLLREEDLSSYTRAARADFDARSWALVRVLRSVDADGDQGGLTRLRRHLDAGAMPPLFETLGMGPDELSERIFDYVKKASYRVEVLQLDEATEREPVVRPIGPAEARVALAELALRLERPKLAEAYFERALAADPDDAHALAGLACARADRFDAAEPIAKRALAAADAADPAVLVRVADFYRQAAESTSPVDEERRARLGRARSLYGRALEVDDRSVAARLGLALVFLDEGRDLAQGLRWLETARALRPGSLELDLVLARFEAAMGADLAARRSTRSPAPTPGRSRRAGARCWSGSSSRLARRDDAADHSDSTSRTDSTSRVIASSACGRADRPAYSPIHPTRDRKRSPPWPPTRAGRISSRSRA